MVRASYSFFSSRLGRCCALLCVGLFVFNCSSAVPPLPEGLSSKPRQELQQQSAAQAPVVVDWQGLRKSAKVDRTVKTMVDGHRFLPTQLPGQRLDLSGGKFIAHEWGTFTSLQGSDGAVVDGMHHEDEHLPPFVHRRSFLGPKSFEIVPSGVTQKLETPVIYFYTKKAMKVRVEVDFPKGILSEWYPYASDFKPAVPYATQQDPKPPADGFMAWDALLQPGHPASTFPEVSADNIWAPSRQVPDATPVVVKMNSITQAERFIFYRGLGRFQGSFRVLSSKEGVVTLRNDSDQPIPASFLLWVHEGQGAIVKAGPIPAKQRITVQTPSRVFPMETYIKQATETLALALKADGLTHDEAWSMVNTWRKSYFKTPGLRALYVVPRAWTDALLPIRITPKPDELVRTLVGRVEIFTGAEEQALLAMLKRAADRNETLSMNAFGRFVEPKLRRILQMLTDPVHRKYCQNLIQRAAMMP